MENILIELINAVKELSPEIWAVLLKQVYVECISTGIWALFLIISTIALCKWGNYAMKRYEEEDGCNDWNMVYVLCYVFTAITAIISVALITTTIMHLINPQYYAIKLLLNSIGGS